MAHLWSLQLLICPISINFPLLLGVFSRKTVYVQLFSHSFSFWCLVGLVGTGNGMIVRRCYNIYQHNILFHIDICQRLVNNFLHRSKWLCLKIGYIPNEIAIFFWISWSAKPLGKKGYIIPTKWLFSLLNVYYPYKTMIFRHTVRSFSAAPHLPGL